MSDVRPGHGWWQAADGKWYPPELRPAQQLIRDRRGATLLVGPDTERDRPEPRNGTGAEGVAPVRTSREDVGGAIDSHTELYLGRPAGMQNRPAAWFALAGAVVMLVGALMPWASRSMAVGDSTSLGWRDAGGELGGGLYIVLLAITVMTVSVRCMAGSYSRGWRAALVGLASAAIALAVVEAVRIYQAIGEVDDLARGNVTLSFGPGLVVVILGALLVQVAAAAYRVGSPD